MSYIENLESINKKMIVEKKGLKITQDAILLSKFIKKYFDAKYKNLKEKKTFLEIGAGQGIISLLLSELDIISQIFAVEIQKDIFEILKKNVDINSLDEKIIPVNENIKNIKSEYDLIFSNPPYKKINSGKIFNNLFFYELIFFLRLSQEYDIVIYTILSAKFAVIRAPQNLI